MNVCACECRYVQVPLLLFGGQWTTTSFIPCLLLCLRQNFLFLATYAGPAGLPAFMDSPDSIPYLGVSVLGLQMYTLASKLI